jgi:hypothetical protein
MILATVVLGAGLALILFAARLFLPASTIGGYDRGTLALFRWTAIAGLAGFAAAVFYAIAASH